MMQKKEEIAEYIMEPLARGIDEHRNRKNTMQAEKISQVTPKVCQDRPIPESLHGLSVKIVTLGMKAFIIRELPLIWLKDNEKLITEKMEAGSEARIGYESVRSILSHALRNEEGGLIDPLVIDQLPVMLAQEWAMEAIAITPGFGMEAPGVDDQKKD